MHTPSGTQEEHHIVQAIKMPAPPHAHVHGHAAAHPDVPADGTPLPLSSPRSPGQIDASQVLEPATPVSPSSKSSTDSDSEEDEDEDDEREEEESETDEEEENPESEQRKTSVCAGVEKISRHKELEAQ